jgi:hypothetical protein
LLCLVISNVQFACRGEEGAWAGDYHVVAEHFGKYGPIMQKKLVGQYPSHWVATKRSNTKVRPKGRSEPKGEAPVFREWTFKKTI